MDYLLMLLVAGGLIYVVLTLKKVLNYDNTEGLSNEHKPGGIEVVRESKNNEEDDENE
jgi:hypothetical protein